MNSTPFQACIQRDFQLGRVPLEWIKDEECHSPPGSPVTTDAYLDLVTPEKADGRPVPMEADIDPMGVVDAALNRLGTDDIEDCL